MWPLPPNQYELQKLKHREFQNTADQERLAQQLPHQRWLYEKVLASFGRALVFVGERLQQPERPIHEETVQPRLQRQP
ncbi:MAG: hypothetical protein H6672_12115 [Anaerolineaceae bacterium]|nr:hypothetical protein [Anaerolineaceae bacterium]